MSLQRTLLNGHSRKALTRQSMRCRLPSRLTTIIRRRDWYESDTTSLCHINPPIATRSVKNSARDDCGTSSVAPPQSEHHAAPPFRLAPSHRKMSVHCPVPSPTSTRRHTCPLCSSARSTILAPACSILLHSNPSAILDPLAPGHLAQTFSRLQHPVLHRVTRSSICSTMPRGLELSHYLHPPPTCFVLSAFSPTNCALTRFQLRAAGQIRTRCADTSARCNFFSQGSPPPRSRACFPDTTERQSFSAQRSHPSRSRARCASAPCASTRLHLRRFDGALAALYTLRASLCGEPIALAPSPLVTLLLSPRISLRLHVAAFHHPPFRTSIRHASYSTIAFIVRQVSL